MNPYSFSLLCFGFCSLLVGLLIWLKRSDAVGKIYFIFSAFNGLWGISFGIFLNQHDYHAALFYVRLADTFALFIPATWFHFSLIYTEKVRSYRGILKVFYFLAVLSSFFGFSVMFIPELRPGVGLIYFTSPGWIFHFLLLMFITVIPFGFFLLWQKMSHADSAEKTQLKGFIIATSLGFLGGGLTMPLSYGIIVPQYAMFLMPFYPFLTAYFLIRKGLFDVEELVQAAHRDKLMAIGVLAASINHEVKNPLFVIKGLSESWLEREKEGIFKDAKQTIESGRDAMKRSMDQADRAMDIIKRLSLFAKAGIEGEIKFESLSVAEVLEDILPLVRHELAAHNIVLTREIPKDLPDVRGDRRYLEEILFNLIVNACQAFRPNSLTDNLTANWASPGDRSLKDNKCQGKEKAGEREIRVTASVIASEAKQSRLLKGEIATPQKEGLAMTNLAPVMASRADGEAICITIQDTGPGIPADKLRDVFRPFYTTKAEGTGLGLYITKQLIEKIGGRIDVQSAVGEGTIFTVILTAEQSLRTKCPPRSADGSAKE